MTVQYVDPNEPGFTRLRWGRGFTYRDAAGKTIDDPEVRARIASLAIPPAWTDVWICPDPNGHIQATGRDEKGRKQYRYHPQWETQRNQHKFDRMLDFGAVLPKVRQITNDYLQEDNLSREKVLAIVVCLLDTTLIRIGNTEYTRQNDSYGLTTLRDRHVEIHGKSLRFQFKGKSGKEHEVEITSPELAKAVKACQDIPGYDLFQYHDGDGQRHSVSSTDVNDFLREITGDAFSAKDFRTWGGSRLAVEAVADILEMDEAPANPMKQVVEHVCDGLGNTPAICRDYYIHPAIFAAYEDGRLGDFLDRAEARKADYSPELDPYEVTLLLLIEAYT